MKAAPFEYVRPESVAEACGILVGDEDARIISGGQTLIPMLAMRLARPSRLVDIYRIAGLDSIQDEGDAIAIGATTRQVNAEQSSLISRKLPLLAKAMPWVGHPPTRNRGTVGGSLANADPSAEIPLVAVTLNAAIEITNPEGVSPMSGEEFFIGPMLTAMMPGDCLTAVRFPVWPQRRVGAAFHEISARKSDFALVAAAAQVAIDENGRCLAAALGIGGVSDRPTSLDVSGLIGTTLDPNAIADMLHSAIGILEPFSDLHASSAYRMRVATTLGVRALADAARDAGTKREGMQ